jgi:hypothetical protein
MNNVIAPALIKALQKKYDAEFEVAFAECIVYVANSTGIGEHSDIVTEIDKKIQTMHDAMGKKEMITKFFVAKPAEEKKDDNKPAN